MNELIDLVNSFKWLCHVEQVELFKIEVEYKVFYHETVEIFVNLAGTKSWMKFFERKMDSKKPIQNKKSTEWGKQNKMSI